MRWSSRGYAVLLIISLGWTAGIFLSPFLHHLGSDTAAIFGRVFYTPICHQDEARSFFLFGWPLSVCHRCASIYVAFTVVVLLFPVIRRARIFHSLALPGLAVFIVPMILDYVFDVLGIWSNSALSRGISGMIAGAGLAVFTVPAWMELWPGTRSRISHTNTEDKSWT